MKLVSELYDALTQLPIDIESYSYDSYYITFTVETSYNLKEVHKVIRRYTDSYVILPISVYANQTTYKIADIGL